MAMVLTRSVDCASSKKAPGLRAAAWHDAKVARTMGAMARPRKKAPPVRPDLPHPFAHLAPWREAAGLTQEQVAEMFHVTGVTVHRWETGKSPVTVPNYLLLAKLYRAPTVGALMFPVEMAQHAAELEAASRILDALPPGKRQRWLEVGQDMGGLLPAPDTAPEENLRVK